MYGVYCQVSTQFTRYELLSLIFYCYLYLGKRRVNYSAAIQILRDAAEFRNIPIAWEAICCDFELSIMLAFREKFPQISFWACLFHFCQVL